MAAKVAAPRSIRRRTILVELAPSNAFMRGVIAGVGKFSRERPQVRLRQSSAEWELIGEKVGIEGVIAAVYTDDPHHPSTRFSCSVVNVSCVAERVPFPTVAIDNIAVGRLAADHLLAQGYSHFACHIESRVFFSRMRAEGFRQRLAESDRACSFFDTAPADSSQKSATALRQATAAWLQQLPKPLGLFTHTDTRAATLIEICQEAGLAVPEQVGVIGVDDERLLLTTLTPSLSSIDPAADVIGYRAAELLLDLLEGAPPPPEPILIPPRGIVQRQSTEPAFVDDELLAKAVYFIREHATDPVDVADVIDAVPLSRRTLERRFRRRLGRSPADEIRRVQMDRAKSLLLDSHQKPAAIARAVGFTSFRNFATAFRREVGMTPMQYFRIFRSR